MLLEMNFMADINLSSEEAEEKIVYETTKLLFVLNFNAAYKGFGYIKESIIYIVLNNKRDINLSRDVYPHICDKFCVSVPQIEKSIRLSLNQASLCQDFRRLPKDLCMYFQDVLKYPRNKDFIAVACEIIGSRLRGRKYVNFAY